MAGVFVLLGVDYERAVLSAMLFRVLYYVVPGDGLVRRREDERRAEARHTVGNGGEVPAANL